MVVGAVFVAFQTATSQTGNIPHLCASHSSSPSHSAFILYELDLFMFLSLPLCCSALLLAAAAAYPLLMRGRSTIARDPSLAFTPPLAEIIQLERNLLPTISSPHKLISISYGHSLRAKQAGRQTITDLCKSGGISIINFSNHPLETRHQRNCLLLLLLFIKSEAESGRAEHVQSCSAMQGNATINSWLAVNLPLPFLNT